MMNHLPKKDKWIAGAGTLLVLLLIFYAQFYFLTPIKDDLSSKQQSLKSEQKVLEVISQKKGDSLAAIVENTSELQMKVPVKPLQDQFLLDLEKAETISNSEIKSMGFSKDNQVETETTAAGNPPQADGESTQTQQETIELPSGLKKLSVQLTVESPSYEEFEKFVGALEALKRIVVVESIQYTGTDEITNLEQASKPFEYSLLVSAYYFPELLELEAQLPKMEVPAPANKDNPLSQFPETIESEEE